MDEQSLKPLVDAIERNNALLKEILEKPRSALFGAPGERQLEAIGENVESLKKTLSLALHDYMQEAVPIADITKNFPGFARSRIEDVIVRLSLTPTHVFRGRGVTAKRHVIALRREDYRKVMEYLYLEMVANQGRYL